MTKPAVADTYIVKSRDLHNDYHSLILGPFSKAGACTPGSFVHLRLPESDIYFRRAMSVAATDPDSGHLEIIYKVFGRGTSRLAKMRTGDRLDILGPLGVGFSAPKKNERVICIAGGIGFPPLLFQATALIAKGHDPKKIAFFYGGRAKQDIIETARIKKLGVDFRPVTEDGSVGARGLVTSEVATFIEANPKDKFRIYACGPEGMLAATNRLGLDLKVPGELALEAPMPCGIGVCLGCVVPRMKGGYARVCVEGPVFAIGEVKL